MNEKRNLQSLASVGTETLETGDTPVAERRTEDVPRVFIDTGHVLINRQVLDFLPLEVIDRYLTDHVIGRWGDCESEMSVLNEDCYYDGGPIVSEVSVTEDDSLHIITDTNRYSTVITMKKVPLKG
ncbi:MAG: hypothetical protein HYR83_12725 [Planctomycetes bacterium]|nr:hypothetical protein [Planctomycetota bacterium]